MKTYIATWDEYTHVYAGTAEEVMNFYNARTVLTYEGEYWLGSLLHNHKLVEANSDGFSPFRWEGNDLYCGSRRWNDAIGEFEEVL